ncbi:MAG: ElyC/SanA/YdcF family protein [Patescibacteria group bacterium]
MQRKFFLFRPRFIFLAVILISVIGISGINFHVASNAAGKIFREAEELPQKEEASQKKVALVLGAGIKQDGNLSDVLVDRLESVFELYALRKVRKIIVSGDNGSVDYDETNAMRDYLLERGIPPRDIFTDYAGFDTFDSIFRAQEIFGADELIIVSQEFHLPRALFLAKSLGIEAVGFSANLREYRNAKRMLLRETFANVKAVGDVLFNSQPKFLGEKIPIDGDGRESWDEENF